MSRAPLFLFIPGIFLAPAGRGLVWSASKCAGVLGPSDRGRLLNPLAVRPSLLSGSPCCVRLALSPQNAVETVLGGSVLASGVQSSMPGPSGPSPEGTSSR